MKAFTYLLPLLTFASLAFAKDCVEYKVKENDYCYKIATENCHTTLEKILSYNPDITNPESIVPGQRVCCTPGEKPKDKPARSSSPKSEDSSSSGMSFFNILAF